MITRSQAREEIIARIAVSLEAQGFRVGPIPKAINPKGMEKLHRFMAETNMVDAMRENFPFVVKNFNFFMIYANVVDEQKRFDMLAALADARVIPNVRAQGGVLSRASRNIKMLLNGNQDARVLMNEMVAQGLRNVRDAETGVDAPTFRQQYKETTATFSALAKETGLVYVAVADAGERISRLTEDQLAQILIDTDPDLGLSPNKNLLLFAAPVGIHQMGHDLFEHGRQERSVKALIEAGFVGEFKEPPLESKSKVAFIKNIVMGATGMKPLPDDHMMAQIHAGRELVRTRLEDLITARTIEITLEERVKMAPKPRPDADYEIGDAEIQFEH